MLKTCEQCGTGYLSEADPHAYVWRGKLWEDNCGCFFVGEMKAELQSTKEKLGVAVKALEFYGDEERWMENEPNSARYGRIPLDYENREYSHGMGQFQLGGKRARKALKQIKEEA